MKKPAQLKVKAKSLLSRVGGVSAFGLGLSWKAPELDRTVVRDLLTFLEDRRALYVGSVYEQPDHVVASVLKMREELTTALKRISDDAPAKSALRIMRASCQQFLADVGSGPHRMTDWNGYVQERFLLALGRLRATMGHHIGALAEGYSIDLDKRLLSLLPPDPDMSDK